MKRFVNTSIFMKAHFEVVAMHNKHIKNRPQKAWTGLATARLLCERYEQR